jgi:hypothetical protein
MHNSAMIETESERDNRTRQEVEEDAWYRWEEEQQLLKTEEEAEKRQSAIDDMVQWFSEQFEDPQNETHYDSEDGRYIYMWGGPFDAHDVLTDFFGSEYEEKWIADAVESVQSDGTFEWAPKASGDYYDHPEQDVYDAAEIALDEQDETDKGEIADRIFAQLDELEKRIAELEVTPSSLGHNNPPDEIGLPPYDEEAKKELAKAIAETREEVSADDPNAGKLQKSESTFRKWSKAILLWIGRKADLAVDEAIKASMKPIAWSVFAAYLASIADDIILLIGAL